MTTELNNYGSELVANMQESKHELSIFQTQWELKLAQGVTENNIKEFSSAIALGKKQVKNITTMRLAVTSKMNDVISYYINLEREITKDANKLISDMEVAVNLKAQELERIERERKAKIELEKNRNIERETIISNIHIIGNQAVLIEVQDLHKAFEMSWKSVTKENINQKIATLKGYNPRLNYDKILAKINLKYSYLNPDEVEQLIKDNLNYELLNKTYQLAGTSLRDKYLELASGNDVVIDNDIDDKITALENERKDKEVEININNEIEAQAKLQAIGNVTGIRKVYKAEFTKDTDWNEVIKSFVAKNGYDKLEFLKTFLVKDRPKIKGVFYVEEIKKVNRV